MRKKVERDSQRDTQASRQQWDDWTKPYREQGRRFVLNAGVMHSDQVLDAGFGDAVLRYTNARSLIREGHHRRIARKRGGSEAAAGAKRKAAVRREKYAEMARKLLSQGKSPHSVASIIACREGVSAATVRRALKKTD